ncbi:acyltransferase domain-containing protein [Sarocladium implicatum]|nr:acyltransferase domain-containing protein [Sarocladium implicatum]
MAATPPPARPGLTWRVASMALAGATGALCRGFIYGLNNVEVTGLNNLLDILDRRRKYGADKGLLTVSNHVMVLDDPIMWGILPMKYFFDTENLRWGLGAHDICYKNRFTSTFFSMGQVLPTHRNWHSPHGGLYQPTMTQAIKLLSKPSADMSAEDKFYTTTGQDRQWAPAAYSANRNAWVHIFPEACCHQSPGDTTTLRYFKWGVSRLILESDPAPEFLPMFINGTKGIMAEDRGFPRFLPRARNNLQVTFGEASDVDELFGEQRKEWRRLVKEADGDEERLRTGPEAQQLRIEVAKMVRDEIGRLRVKSGLPEDKDESAALAETWAKEPNKRRFQSPVDGSLVNRQ